MAEGLMKKLRGKTICGHKARITLAPVSDDDWGSNGGPRGRGGRSGGRRSFGSSEGSGRSDRRDRGGFGGDRRGGKSRSRY